LSNVPQEIQDSSCAFTRRSRKANTSISEETTEWKQPVKPIRVIRKEPTQKLKRRFSLKAFLKKPFVAMYNYCQEITFSNDRHDRINNKMQHFLGTIFCIRADVSASLQ
jgi:hypothetical protein